MIPHHAICPGPPPSGLTLTELRILVVLTPGPLYSYAIRHMIAAQFPERPRDSSSLYRALGCLAAEGLIVAPPTAPLLSPAAKRSTIRDARSAALGDWQIPLGAPVSDAAGEKLGSVRAADAYALIVGQGVRFVTEWEIPLHEVEPYEDGRLILKRTKAELQQES